MDKATLSDWLSHVSDPLASTTTVYSLKPPSWTYQTHSSTSARRGRKRKAEEDNSDKENSTPGYTTVNGSKRIRAKLDSHRRAGTSPVILNMPQPPKTPEQERKKKAKKPKQVQTPDTQTPASSSNAPSSFTYSSTHITGNVQNVRQSLAEHGMRFDDKASYLKYPALKEKVDAIICAERSSVLHPSSILKIQEYRDKNATMDEKSYYKDLVPMVMKDKTHISTKKRTATEEIVLQARSLADEGLIQKTDCLFLKGILPHRETVEYALGLTEPKPDYVFARRSPQHPDPTAPIQSNQVKRLIGVAPGTKHAFFAIENKNCNGSIEEAENQAIKTGGTLVEANRGLRNLADPDRQWVLGADLDSLAFTCCWVPTLARIYLHWVEVVEGQYARAVVYHTNRVGSYLMDDAEHVAALRRNAHNILEWGIDQRRQEELQGLEEKLGSMEELHKPSSSKAASQKSSVTS